ncbi:MAG TPA: hypothetical protein VGQ57_07935 [Polyangiaceae bacterium]|jgi:hypothetical protein|nr:hypothetical protein [Polyangiaceae bacterium]
MTPAARRLSVAARAAGLAWITALSGCESRAVPAGAGPGEPSEPSPNASILPAPLATGPETVPAAAAGDAGPSDAGTDAEVVPPVSAREDQAFPADFDEPHELAGVLLRGRFRWPDVTPPGRQPEMNVDALDRARSAATFDLDVTAAASGRLAVVLAAPRFVLAQGSEFRARTDHYGQVLLWPDRSRYGVVQAGALRSVLNERRGDVVPLAHIAGTSRGPSQALGYAAERVHFATPLGKLELEQAHVAAAGAGGALFCRFLVELASVHPDTPSCRSEYLPVRAEYTWLEGGAVVFEVTALERSSGLDPTALRVPPVGIGHRIGELPAPPDAPLVERTQLRGLRFRPAPARPAKDAPKDGLVLANGDDLLRYALLDSIPVARLGPHGGISLELLPGTYSVAARTFLGDEITPPTLTTVPGKLTLAEPALKEIPAADPTENGPGPRPPAPTRPLPGKSD